MSTIPKIIVILGPTASGKSDLALYLAQQLNGEIISADSMQVYRGMDIGTAKLSLAERQNIPHHLLDVCDPQDYFSVADYRQLAEKSIANITNLGKQPIVAGGTGLYIDSLLRPYNFSETADVDLQLREELKQRLADKGSAALHQELSLIDSAAAERIHHNDSRRILRALEVWYSSGQTITSLQQNHSDDKKPYDAVLIGLTMERELLYNRINRRVDIMMEQGLLNEVEDLIESGVQRNATSMLGLGYRQLAAYIAGEISLEEAVNLIKRDTRRYAKRQLTWFKRNGDINWFNVDHYREAEALQHDVLRLIKAEFAF